MYLNDVEGYEILIKPLLILKVPVFYFKLIWMKIKIVEKLPENMINSFIQPWILKKNICIKGKKSPYQCDSNWTTQTRHLQVDILITNSAV